MSRRAVRSSALTRSRRQQQRSWLFRGVDSCCGGKVCATACGWPALTASEVADLAQQAAQRDWARPGAVRNVSARTWHDPGGKASSNVVAIRMERTKCEIISPILRNRPQKVESSVTK